jgi:hypothetical protein
MSGRKGEEAPDMPERRTVESRFRERARFVLATSHQRTGILAEECSDAIENLRNRCDIIDTEHAEFAETTLEALAAIRKRLDELEFDGLIEDIEDSAKAPTLEMRIQRIELMLGVALTKGVVS